MTVVFPQLEQQLMAAATGPDARPARRRRGRFLRGGLPLLVGTVVVAGSAAAATGLWTPLSSPAPPRPAIEVAKERFSVLHHGRNVLDDPALAQIIRTTRRLTRQDAKRLPFPTEQIPGIDTARLARVDGRNRTFLLSGPRAICTAMTVTRSRLGNLSCFTGAAELRRMADGRMGPSVGKVQGGWLITAYLPDGTRNVALTYADERVEPVTIRGNVAAVVVPEGRSPTAFTWTAPDGAPQRVENPVPTIPPLPPRP